MWDFLPQTCCYFAKNWWISRLIFKLQTFFRVDIFWICDFLVLYIIILQKIGSIRDFLLLSVAILDQSELNSQRTIIHHQQYEISTDTTLWKTARSYNPPTPIISSILKKQFERFFKKWVEFSENGENFLACTLNFMKNMFFW